MPRKKDYTFYLIISRDQILYTIGSYTCSRLNKKHQQCTSAFSIMIPIEKEVSPLFCT